MEGFTITERPQPGTPRGDRRDAIWLWALFAGSLVLRLAHLASVRDSPFFTWLILDPRMYDEWAQRIAAGDWLGDRPFFQDPLYPYLLALCYRVVGHDYVPAVALQMLLGSTVAPLLYSATRRWLGRAAAAVAGVLAALYLPSVFYEGLIEKTGLAVWLVTLGFWLLSGALHAGGTARPTARVARIAPWFAIGAVFGLAALARGNLVLFLPVLVVWVFVDAPLPGCGGMRRDRLRSGAVLAAAAALVAGAGLVLGTTAARNRVAGGEWILTTSNAGQNFYIGNNPGNRSGRYEKVSFVDANPKHEEQGFAREARARVGRDLTPSEVSRFWFRESLRWIRDEPGTWLALVGRKARGYWGAYEVPDNVDYYLYRESAPLLRLPLPGFGVVVPLGLLGAALCWRRAGWPRILLLFVTVYAASVILFFVFSRFRMPMLPPLFVLAGHAVAELGRRAAAVRGRTIGPRALAVPLAGLAVLAAGVNVPVHGSPRLPAYRVAQALGLPTRLETTAQAHFNLGVSYAAQALETDDPAGLLALAEVELRTALAEGSEFAVNHVELGKVLARQGRTAEALEQYRAAMALEPQDYRNPHGIGLLERRQGNLAAAAGAFRRALDLEPRHLASALRLGEVLLELQSFDEAEAAFAHALRLEPESAAARRGLEAARARQPMFSAP